MRTRFTLLAAGVFLSCIVGCAPMVVCTVETVVTPDYTCTRVLRLDASPDPNYPNQRPRLGEYFLFPPAELYETYMAQPEKALFAGAFDNFSVIPPDLARVTPGTDKVARNTFSFWGVDLGLVVMANFDETLSDIIVSREDGLAAIGEFMRLVVPEIMAVLNARYGSKYDLSRLDQWLTNDLVAKLQRIYSGAWNIRSAKRSGVTSPGEAVEMYVFLMREAQREGLELAPVGTPNLEQENIRRLKEYGAQKARELCPPRQAGGAPLSPDMLSGSVGEELLGALQKAVTARHGSINEFIRKVGAIIPRALGAYLTGEAMPLYMLPEVSYTYRLRVPGTILQTNGLRDVSGDIIWSFDDTDLALTGQSMWARTLYVREPVVHALGLRNFPSSLTDVDQLYGLAVNSQGQIRDALFDTLEQCVLARSLAPMEALANTASSPDSGAARGVLELLQKFRAQDGAAQPSAQPPARQPAAPAAAPQAPQQPQLQPPAVQAPAVQNGAPPALPAPQAAAPVRNQEYNNALTPLQPLEEMPNPARQAAPATSPNVTPIAPPPQPR